jgi:hypothetical protein
MRTLPLPFLVACGYSSHWPDLPDGTAPTEDSAPGTSLYVQGTPPCSTTDPYREPSQLELFNVGDRDFYVYTTDPGTCGEVLFTSVAVGGAWSGTVDSNLVFVVRGPYGGLVRWFGVPSNSDWVESLP